MSGKDEGIIELLSQQKVSKRKAVEHFFNLSIFRLFKREFIEWEEYKKKLAEMEEQKCIERGK